MKTEFTTCRVSRRHIAAIRSIKKSCKVSSQMALDVALESGIPIAKEKIFKATLALRGNRVAQQG